METPVNQLQMKNVCYYLRNSTEHQEYIFQRQALDKQFNNLRNVNFYGEFAEKISGFKGESERPEMNRLLNLINSNTVENLEIWCYDVARLSRESINLLNIVKTCTAKGVNIYFLANNLNTLNPDKSQNDTTKLIIAILAQFAETDAKQLKSKMLAGKYTKGKTGTQYIGGSIPVGYYDSDKIIFVDENRKKVVEYVFNEYVNENKSMMQIAKQLNILKNLDNNFIIEKEYRQRKGGMYYHNKWSAATVASMLKCTWYVGYKNSFGEIVQLPEHLKIIPLDVWAKAQNKKSENKNRGTDRKHVWLLKDLIYCECGEKYISHHLYRPKTGATGNYICLNNKINREDKSIKCIHNNRSVSAQNLESALWLLIKNKLPEFRMQIEQITQKEQSIDLKIQAINDYIATIENVELKDLEAQKGRALDAYIKFNINVDDKMSAINKQITELNKMVAEKKTEITNLKISAQNLDVADEIAKNILRIEKDKQLIKTYLNKLINKIIIHAFNSPTHATLVEIFWNDNVNSYNTFLFYNHLKNVNKQDNKYYFVSSAQEQIQIKWNVKEELLYIYNDDFKEHTTLSLPQIKDKMNAIYSDTNEKKYNYIQYVMHPINSLEDSRNMYNMLKFAINTGVAPLEIVVPFE